RAPSFHLSGAVTDRSRAASWGAARSAVPVLLLVVGAELAGLERSPPRLVLPVPADRRGQRVAERVARPPAEPPDLGGVERVATVVPGPVLHGADQRLGLAGQAEDLAGEVDVLDFGPAPDVVHLAVPAPAQHQVDGRAVVAHEQPVADVAPVAVE